MTTSGINLQVDDKELDVIMDSLGLLIMEYDEYPQVYARFKESRHIALKLRSQFKLVRSLRKR
jgi:hypothetical protein